MAFCPPPGYEIRMFICPVAQGNATTVYRSCFSLLMVVFDSSVFWGLQALVFFRKVCLCGWGMLWISAKIFSGAVKSSVPFCVTSGLASQPFKPSLHFSCKRRKLYKRCPWNSLPLDRVGKVSCKTPVGGTVLTWS